MNDEEIKLLREIIERQQKQIEALEKALLEVRKTVYHDNPYRTPEWR